MAASGIGAMYLRLGTAVPAWSRWATSARAAEAYNPQSLRHEAEARGGDRMGRVPQNGLGKGKARQGGRQEDALRAGETAISLGLPNRTSHRTFALRLGVVTVYLFSSADTGRHLAAAEQTPVEGPWYRSVRIVTLSSRDTHKARYQRRSLRMGWTAAVSGHLVPVVSATSAQAAHRGSQHILHATSVHQTCRRCRRHWREPLVGRPDELAQGVQPAARKVPD
ncbi:hypothetical protein OH76DRAFT_991634 [Lentinus brumalis]|uniref:Uncharacterized protein n=1 Tax=Lentinus brumalis TaxID=2498619 RepID=A0A371DQA5_9APHY|nr:hypothetical protein OH76DRAFT_991634 [Polyporus brumalis]